MRLQRKATTSSSSRPFGDLLPRRSGVRQRGSSEGGSCRGRGAAVGGSAASRLPGASASSGGRSSACLRRRKDSGTETQADRWISARASSGGRLAGAPRASGGATTAGRRLGLNSGLNSKFEMIRTFGDLFAKFDLHRAWRRTRHPFMSRGSTKLDVCREHTATSTNKHKTNNHKLYDPQ